MKTGGVTGDQLGREGTANQPHNHTTQTFSSTRHTSDRISTDKVSRKERPHSRPNNKAEKKVEGTKGRTDVEFVAMGNKKTSTGEAATDRCAATTEIQHKYD